MAKDSDAACSRSVLRDAARLARRPFARTPLQRLSASRRKAASQAGVGLATVAPRCRWSRRSKAFLANVVGRSSVVGRSAVVVGGRGLGRAVRVRGRGFVNFSRCHTGRRFRVVAGVCLTSGCSRRPQADSRKLRCRAMCGLRSRLNQQLYRMAKDSVAACSRSGLRDAARLARRPFAILPSRRLSPQGERQQVKPASG